MSKYLHRVTSVNRGRATHMDQNNKGNYYNRDNWDNKAPEGGDGDEGEPEAEVTGQAEPEEPVEVAEVEEEAVAVVEAEVLQEQTVVV